MAGTAESKGHLHDAPTAMAIALVVLAIGSVVAGYVGIPNAIVHGGNRLRGGDVDARNDHRLAMAFAIAALGATGATTIHDAGAAAVSYPEFFSVLESLRA